VNAFYFLDEKFWSNPGLVILFLSSIFFIVLGRYLFISYSYDVAIKKIVKQPQRKFGQEKKVQHKKEIINSIYSSLIFTFLGAGSFWLYQKGFTRIYANFEDHSVAYFLFSIALILFLYETYYYWLHRWMHSPSVYRIVHKVHHDSIHTSVFTSFSFHPLEAILQFVFLPVIIMAIPVHIYALAIVLMLMTISAVINHAGVEIFPRHFASHPIGKWLIGSTHHDLHHKQFRNNFGLYFTFWDKWMHTESSDYDLQFKKNTEKNHLEG
jgi:Delta7-sterol 5-desaturase